MADSDNNRPIDRLTEAYEAMLQRVHEVVEDIEHTGSDRLRQALDQAREKAVELDELSREEAQRIGDYLARDLKDAARFVADTGADFRDWLRFDLQQVGDRMFEAFASVADKTRVELGQWSQWASEASQYRTGEITGPGTLACTACGKQLHFHKAGHIPPCPGCGATRFQRETDEPGGEA